MSSRANGQTQKSKIHKGKDEKRQQKVFYIISGGNKGLILTVNLSTISEVKVNSGKTCQG